MILEFCAENYTDIPKAIQAGASRVELCDNLAVGGTTPSLAVIQKSVTYAQAHQIQTAVMVRPRGGNFVYDETEFDMMQQDLQFIIEFGAEAAVFGCLAENHFIHEEQTKTLIEICQQAGIDSVFHMAFDLIPKNQQLDQLDLLIKLGCTRLLTRGTKSGSALDHLDWLDQLIDHADGRIEILVGGGITHADIDHLQHRLKTDQFHGTKIVPFDSVPD